MSARRHVGRVRFSGIVRALQDGLGPATLASKGATAWYAQTKPKRQTIR